MTVYQADPRIIAFIDDGPAAAPPDVLEAVLLEFPGITPRPRRRPRLPTSLGFIAATATAVVAVVALVIGVAPIAGLGGPVETAQPTATASIPPASGPPSIIPLQTLPPASTWTMFVSAVSGYAIDLPPDWTRSPATEPWPYGKRTDQAAPWLDRMTSPDGRLQVFGRATDLPEPMSIEAWVAAYEAETTSCVGATEWEPIPALEPPDGSAASDWRIREFCGRFVALGVIDGQRGLVISLRPTEMQTSHLQIDEDRRSFERILGTFWSGDQPTP